MNASSTFTRVSEAGKLARKKWEVSLDAGFQIVPNVLFRCQKLLGLDAVDVVILLNIAMHWWEGDNLPYPKPSAIANRMKVATRTVERRIEKLQEKGFLIRLPAQSHQGRMIRPFKLDGLVQKLNIASEANLRLRRANIHVVQVEPLDDFVQNRLPQ